MSIHYDDLPKMLDTDLSFYDQAFCRTPEGQKLDWFDGSTTGQRKCKEACMIDCPVQRRCLEYAINNDLVAYVFGGHTYKERRSMVRRVEIVPQRFGGGPYRRRGF